MLSRLWCRLSKNCPTSFPGSYLFLKIAEFKPVVLSRAWILLYQEPMIVCCGFLRGNWLRNMWKEKLRKNVTRQYLSPECVVWSLNIVVVVSKKPFKWPQRTEGRFQWRRRLLLRVNFTRWSFDSTTRKEFSMKLLFQYSDNQERELKHWNVQLLSQWTQSFFGELRGGFHGNDNRKLCINRNTQFSEKRLCSLTRQLYISVFKLPFLVTTVLK